MTTKRTQPSQKIVKKLFALSGGVCAFPGCGTRLVDSTSAAMIGEMCHIRAASPNGPRYDPTQPDAERNEEQNLLLLCPTHHSMIDQATTEYTVEWLLAAKQKHERWVAERLAHQPQLIDDRQAINLARQVGQSSVDFAIIVALRAEMAALMHYFPELKRTTVSATDVRTYYTAEIPTALGGRYRIVATLLNSMGNLDASHATADLIRDWSPRFVLINGIAGGLSRQDQDFGDVVVSDSVVYYEPGKIGVKGKEYRSKQFQSDRSLLNGLLNLRDSRWKHRLPPRPDGNDATQALPHIHFGPIASGEKVIANATEASRLLDTHRNMIAVEMESAGVASAAFSAIKRIGFLTVRAICDFADSSKNDDWHKYAAYSAASCLRAFLEERPVAPSEGNWPEPNNTPVLVTSVISVELRKRLFLSLRSAVDMEEFKNFCFLLGVDFDELSGDRKSAMIRELILLFERRGEIQVLESAMFDVLPEVR
jgi:nucleoside phosphorylase